VIVPKKYKAISRGSLRAISALLIFFILSCRKDTTFPPECVPDCECVPIPEYTGTGFGYSFQTEGAYLQKPYFNPNNENEFLFEEGGIIYKYNQATQSKETIYAGAIIFLPKWGKNNWVLLNLPDQNIWKIKSNGDSLTQLTSTSNNFYPEWNKAGDRIIFYNTALQKSILLDEHGIPLDTLALPIGAISTWQHPSFVANVAGTVSYFDPNTLAEQTVYNFNDFETKTGALWVGNDIYYANDEGIFKVNIFTQVPVLIKLSCNARKYFYPSLAMSGTKIIWQRLDKRLLDAETVLLKSELVVMELDGSGEEALQVN